MFGRMLLAALFARRGRVALALMAVTLGVAVSTALATLALQVGDDLARTLRAAGPNFVVLPAGARLPLDLGGVEFEPARAGLTLRETAVAELKRSFWRNNVLAAAPELTVAVTLERSPAFLVGTWFDREVPDIEAPWRTGLAALRPHWNVTGRWPKDDAEEIAVGRDLAERLSLRIGQTVVVEAGGKEVHWRVTGIVAAGGTDERGAWAPLPAVQALVARPGEIDRIWLSAMVNPPAKKPPPDAEKDPAGYERYMCTAYPANVATDLASRLPGAEVLPMTEVVAGEGMVVERLNLLMLLLALAALTASILGLLSTTTAAVVERGVELGLLRAIGASSTQIASLLLAETALVSLAGGLLGWSIGTLSADAIRGQSFGSVASATPPLLLPVALLLSVGIGLLGTLAPLRMALRLDPAVVLRG